MHNIPANMLEVLKANSVEIDYTDNCDCRKPKTGMIEGDSETDILMAKNANILSVVGKYLKIDSGFQCESIFDLATVLSKKTIGENANIIGRIMAVTS